jgi:hypothetical protein
MPIQDKRSGFRTKDADSEQKMPIPNKTFGFRRKISDFDEPPLHPERISSPHGRFVILSLPLRLRSGQAPPLSEHRERRAAQDGEGSPDARHGAEAQQGLVIPNQLDLSFGSPSRGR